MATSWLTFPIYGNQFSKGPWLVATTVAYDFEAIDTSNYGNILNLVLEMQSGIVNIDVTISWSSTGVLSDAHDDTNPISGTGTTHQVSIAPIDRKDRFLHIEVTQTGTTEAMYAYINGVS